VDNDLFDLPGIRAYHSQVWIKLQDQFDIFRDQAAQQFAEIGDGRIDVECFGLHGALTAESKQLPGERRSPLAGFLDLAEFLEDRAVGAESGFEQLAVRYYRGKQVVEIMGDAPCKPSNGIHLLRLPELLLELFAGRIIKQVAVDL